MAYLLMLCIPITHCCQSMSQKNYNSRVERPSVLLFSAVTSLIALCYFVLTSGFALSFTAELVPYALGFGVCYAAAWVGTVMGVRYGMLSITSLLISCCIVFPTLYGVIVNGEELTALKLVAMAVLLGAMVLVNLKFEDPGQFSFKWLACVLVALFGNGGCSLMQNMQKRALGESYTHEFMIIALAAAAVLLMIVAVVRTPRPLDALRRCVPYAAVNGVCNGLGNFLTLTIIGRLPNTVFYPTNTALGMLASFLLSYIVYRERFSKPQYAGYALGAAAIVLLNV